MAAAPIPSVPIEVQASPAPLPVMRTEIRRRISPEAGHALEILGHAIEYLSDEFVHDGGALRAHDSQIEAVQLLMSLNRRIYLECPEIPPLRVRCWLLLRRLHLV